jgi:hypothetical protein
MVTGSAEVGREKNMNYHFFKEKKQDIEGITPLMCGI